MKIHCQFEDIIKLSDLEDHPKNRNKHSKDQIKRLAFLYKEHGVRHPIIISTLSGYIVAGHGRKAAAIQSGMTEFPVVYQDFESDEKEYAFLISDNAIAEWAELDTAGINFDLSEFKDFNIDSLGIKDFTFGIDEGFNPQVEREYDKESKGKTKMIHECPSCGHRFN